ncbi:MAG: YbaB/EbfC family nucleoid-associated protein [Desulfovibrionaceae bacterium]
MNNLLKQAQAMQSKMVKLQEELARKSVESSSGGGMVTVVVNGEHELLSIAIDPALVESQDIQMLEELVLLAVNDGQRKAQEMIEQEMGGITGGMNIPGLF